MREPREGTKAAQPLSTGPAPAASLVQTNNTLKTSTSSSGPHSLPEVFESPVGMYPETKVEVRDAMIIERVSGYAEGPA